MLKTSQKVAEILKGLYESEKVTVQLDYSFETVMSSNTNRMAFLNQLFENINTGKLSEECLTLFDENIDFLHKFMNGEINVEISVPEVYANDANNCLIVPTQEDIKYLFSLIEANINLYKTNYKGKRFAVTLPNNSFNMNMGRILEIKYKNLAHLLGLTQNEQDENENKNLLKKHFLKIVKNSELYGKEHSTRLLNWIISEEGKKEILRLNQLTIDFIEKDKKKNPNSYDEKGNIKSLESFKKRFKEDPANEGLDFPIIRFSRYITKCINNLNFLNMSNITQFILDYNAPRDPKNPEKKLEQDEKDIFLVSLSSARLLELTELYKNNKDIIDNYLLKYGKDNSEKDSEIERLLRDIELDKSEIITYLNLIQTFDFVEKHDIKSKEKDYINAKEKIRKFIGKLFLKEIHLIGFGTDFEKDEKKNPIITKLTEITVNESHCDTSIVLDASELIEKYYKRGRAFFLDKIHGGNGKIFRVSTPIEEKEYLRQMELLGIPNKNMSTKLQAILELFNENYNIYRNVKGNKK